MSHEVKATDEHLEFLHGKIMTAIGEVMNHQSPFVYQEKTRALGLDCIKVATDVYNVLSNYMSISSVDDIVSGKKRDCETFGAFPIKDKKLATSVEKIYSKLVKHLDTLPPELFARIVQSSDEMDSNNKNNLFSIVNNVPPFQNKSGALQPVSTGEPKSGEKIFRAHLCQIQMTAGSEVYDELIDAISNCYQSLVETDDEIADKKQALMEIHRQIKKLFDENEDSALLGLRDLLDKESSVYYMRPLMKSLRERNKLN
jgi:hypothetical protein